MISIYSFLKRSVLGAKGKPYTLNLEEQISQRVWPGTAGAEPRWQRLHGHVHTTFSAGGG